jgi:hypothetical protein
MYDETTSSLTGSHSSDKGNEKNDIEPEWLLHSKW